MATYTVKKGDTLSNIAWKYNDTYKYGDTVVAAYKRLAEINHIEDPNRIVVGQVLTLDNPKNSDGSNTSIAAKKSKGSTVEIKAFGLQSNTERTVYISWTWTKSNTKEYKVIWYYHTGDGVWFVGNDSTTEYKQSTYNAPENAKKVRVKICPQSKTYKKNNKDTKYWTAQWSTLKVYTFPGSSIIDTPSAPSVTIDEDKLYLTAELDNIAAGATHIQFQVVRNDSKVTSIGIAKITTGHAAYKCKVGPGYEYKVRCRGVTLDKKNKVDDATAWSEYSSGILTRPAAPKSIKSLKATSATSVQIMWYTVTKATSYEIQYTLETKYFDSSPSNVTSVTVASNVAHSEITGLESGDRYYFRVRAVNDSGNSGWTSTKSVVIGKKPAAPTTWSSKTTAVRGEEVLLYWVHNTEDGSDEKYAEVSISLNGGTPTTKTIKKDTKPDDPDSAVDETSYYTLVTKTYTEGDHIDWQVRTRGIMDTYGPWSTKRRITIHEQPTITFDILDNNKEVISEGTDPDTGIDFFYRHTPISRLPFYIQLDYSPESSTAVNFNISVVSLMTYTYEDYTGEEITVSEGDEIYSKFVRSTNLLYSFTPYTIDLENNMEYRITVTVTLNSGLSASCSKDIIIGWENERDYEPICSIEFNEDTLTASISAYCTDEDNKCISNTHLAVYRHNYDGTFTEIGSKLPNNKFTFVTDPHPALNYLWYRIVATFTDTGETTYYDPPAIPIGIKSIIIQWDEARSDYLNYESILTENEEDYSLVAMGIAADFIEYSGSRVVLPYNVDISESLSRDIALVEYIGREHPVSYYGTQLGESATWNTDIPKEDEATLYSLRRLARWQGDVYVREPSGVGYYATVSVSFSRRHNDVVIPVTLNVTRVEAPNEDSEA